MANWSELSDELLELIARRVHHAKDYAKLGAICKSWRAVMLQKDRHTCSLLPLLMHTENAKTSIRGFRCPFSHNVYELYLPELQDRRCWGSSHGWLVTLNTKYQIHLFNPISRVEILLPPLPKCPNVENIHNPEEFRITNVYKVVLSSDPFFENCVVLAFYSYRKMAFVKPGDDAWTPLQCPPSIVEDAIYFGGNIYAIDSNGNVISCDSNGIHLKTISLTSLFEDYEFNHIASNIVEIGGQIHVILRILSHDGGGHLKLKHRTWCPKIYRLDVCSDKWEEVLSFGNWSVFVGNNESFSLSSSDYPECRRNCIYLTGDFLELCGSDFSYFYKTGIYDLENHKMQPLVFGKDPICAQPVWFKPSLK